MTEIIIILGVGASLAITHITCNKLIDFIGETDEPRRPSKR